MSYNTKNKTFAITQENEQRVKDLASKLSRNQNWVHNAAIEHFKRWVDARSIDEVFDYFLDIKRNQ